MILPATRLPSAMGNTLSLNFIPKNTAMAVPVHTPVIGNGTATKINRLRILISLASFSADPLADAATFSAFALNMLSIFSTKRFISFIFFNRLNIGISKKNSATLIAVEPRYATAAVSKRFKPNASLIPIGIAPFNSISGNIDTNSTAIYLLLNIPIKISPNFNAIIKLLVFFTKIYYYNIIKSITLRYFFVNRRTMDLQKLSSLMRRAIQDYDMIRAGDKIAVGLSGGKDSISLLYGLAALKRYYPENFSLVAITVDMGLGLDENKVDSVKNELSRLGVEFVIEKTEIGKIVFDARKESNPCSLCANMRRGALNNAAKRLGCNKIALGHHADDLIETFFLSLFYEARASVFQPVTKLERTDLTVIRPMIYIREKDIMGFCKDKPIIHNPCPADKHTKREYIKNTIKNLEKDNPKLRENVLSALTHPERNNLFPIKRDDE